MKTNPLRLSQKPVLLIKPLLILILITACFNFSTAQNQTAKVTPGGTWYYEYLPPDYNTNTNKYPIVFFLHGLGERGDTEATLANVARNGPPKHVKAGYQFPFILISPQLKSKYTGWPGSYIDGVIEYCRNNLRIDQSRIYLTGLSLGGGGTWGYVQDPVLNQKIAAIAPICGHSNNPAKACLISNAGIPVWAFHGDADKTVNYSKTVSMIKAYNECIPTPNPLGLITIYPGVGHDSWTNAYKPDHSLHNPNVYEWLLQFKNNGLKVIVGADITLNLPTNSTNIKGTASSEAGPITSYAWTKISGPAVTMTNTDKPTISLTGLIIGNYTFRLTATTSTESGSDDIKITVVSSNQTPVANAGTDITIQLPTNTATIIGSGSDVDGTITTYLWTKTSGPTATMVGADKATLNLSALLQGIYVFTLKVTDNQGATSTDNVTVPVTPANANQLPTANAGADKIINLPTNTTNLLGLGNDPDVADVITYQWLKLSGPTVTLTNVTSSTVSLSALIVGNYTFQLTVKDGKGGSASDQVSVTVIATNQTPTANVGGDIILTLPTQTTNIVGSGSDPEGKALTYAWTQVEDVPLIATIENPISPTVTIKGLTASGIYTFRLTVTDNQGATNFADVNVTVNNAPANPPLANAGADKVLALPTNFIILVGSGTDSDGNITSYAWTKVSGPSSFAVANENTSSLTASNLQEGIYVFRLTVTDNSSLTHFDDVSVTVQPADVNQLPTANAGNDVVMTLPLNSVKLNGSGSDPDGTVATYSWLKLSSPLLTATLSGETTPTLQISNLLEGVYTFQLTVKDSKGAIDTDEISVIINAQNVAPVALAGPDIKITSPTNNTFITGSGSDNDGSIVSYSWTQVTSLPSSATLTNANTNTVSVSALTSVGNYTFRLTVTDDDGATGTDEVSIIVNGSANQAPTANAGMDKIITLPTTSANFTGSGADSEGAIASYNWSQIGLPSVTLTNQGSQTLTVEAITSGSYTFRLTVTDIAGASGYDDVVLNVKEATNQAPTASAGNNQSITLPINAINLIGSETDVDGSIGRYKWTLLSGPTATLVNDNTATVSLSNMIEGNYTFQLMVTDNIGATATAQVSVTVLPAAVNQPPAANAGTDKILTMVDVTPLITTLTGVGNDPEGSIIKYEWSKIGNNAITLSNPQSATVTIGNLTPGIYTFQLKVTDGNDATAIDEVVITVKPANTNKAPKSNTGADQIITLPTNILTLNGSGSDEDGSIVAYSWVKLSGPTVTTGLLTQPSLQLSNLIAGIYKFRLRVKDNNLPTGAVSNDDVIVTVNPEATNQPPLVIVESDKEVFLPVGGLTMSITLDGIIIDPDAAGFVKSKVWTLVEGSADVALVNINTNTLTVNNLKEGFYTFRFTATDNKDATAFDDITVGVLASTANQPPTVNAGSDKVVNINNASLTASAQDVDGTIVSYQWAKINGPACTMIAANSNPLVINTMDEGTYKFQVTVSDDDGAQAFDFINVTVLSAGTNLPPTTNAGNDQSLQLPDNTITLTGSVIDDGATEVKWTKVSGDNVTITGELTAILTLTNLEAGTYVFKIEATDGEGLSDSDLVTVSVSSKDINLPLSVKVRGDSIIELPNNSTTITATIEAGTNGLISFKWTQIFGSPINILLDTTDILQVSGLTLGTYGFKATVKDNNGQESSDELMVTVSSGVSNAFWPETLNSNGKPGTWHIGRAEDYKDSDINVYNREGSKVYHSAGYDVEWDGTSNGKPLPEGVYFYVIRRSGEKPKTGSVTIIR